MTLIQKKVCMLGDFAVGKTSLVRRSVEGRFDNEYLSTIGVRISRKPIFRGDQQINLLLWDLAGGESFIQYQPNYLRGAVGALIVCDLTRRETLDSLSHYVHQLRGINPSAVFVLAGNKADLAAQHELTPADFDTIRAELRAPLFLTSAKTGDKVDEAMKALADLIAGKYAPPRV